MRLSLRPWIKVGLVVLVALSAFCASGLALAPVVAAHRASSTASTSTPTSADTWAVIVNASKFFLNYRHTANAMAMYHTLRRLGLPDDRIILMHADCSTCDARMVHPGSTYTLPGSSLEERLGAGFSHDLFDGPPEVDYRDKDVTADALLRVLTGNTHYGTSPGQILGSTNTSNVLLFLTGHGGDGFLKFHDQTELMSSDLGAAVEYMYHAGRYKNMLIVLDTCQASTMYEDIGQAVRGWAGAASSKRGQSSYALNHDGQIGTFLVDEFSHWITTWLEKVYGRAGDAAGGAATIDDMLKYVMRQRMSSEVQYDSSRVATADKGHVVETFFGGHSNQASESGWRRADKASWDQQLQ